MTASLPPRPTDATLSVTKAARLLGVHPNTVRAWSDAGRLRYYRINPRGDRRYRLGDLQRFLAAAEHGPTGRPDGPPWGRRPLDPAYVAQAVGARSRTPRADAIATAPEAIEGSPLELGTIEALARLARRPGDLDDDLAAAGSTIGAQDGRPLVAIYELRGERLVVRCSATAPDARPGRLADQSRSVGVLGRALGAAGDAHGGVDAARAEAVLARPEERITLTTMSGHRAELAVAIPGATGPWGVLLIVADGRDPLSPIEQDRSVVMAELIGSIVAAAQRREEVAHLLHRAEALRRVASDIGGRLDLDRILIGLVDHALVLFEAQRGVVYLRRPGGSMAPEASRGLSAVYLNAVRGTIERGLPGAAAAARRPLFATGYRDDPRGADVRSAVVQEGFDTICTVPLMDGPDLLGILEIDHDDAHHWSTDELETFEGLAAQASVAIRTAQNFVQMTTWTAQLQSIQQLGARLNHLSSVKDIGLAIATELRQLIDYHNARVYRQHGDQLIPVAIAGQIGEYMDETPEQLRVAVGEGITGWVAEHRIAQNLPDAAADPRANTIPGTEDDLDESMLLAPMLFEDEVLGVLVLSKLGLDQFGDDDLRLLVIYASFAAQAMANADTNERLREQSAALERQVRSQRALLQITESILTTFDGHAVLESITERLGDLIACDNVAIEVVDPSSGLLTPLTARGIHAVRYLEPWEPGESGIATWVVEHNEAVHISDERNDPRVNHFRDSETLDGSLIVVPLRGRNGAIGVLTMERLGLGNTFAVDEFDLVQLFAAQVSIALQNAEVFQAIEMRAQTDGLTGLLNHASLQDHLGRLVREGSPFGLIMLDLDDFREINNTMGHQAGDEALREIAGALVRAGRETDLVFRYGGDEFAFLLPHSDAAGTRGVADRARAAVKRLRRPVTASVGVATFPLDGGTATDVLLAADRACFVAKRGGRDSVATAAEGLALAAEVRLQDPTPVDSAVRAGD